VAAIGLLGSAISGCGTVRHLALEQAAVGTWACRSSAPTRAPDLRVDVKASGHFTLGWSPARGPAVTSNVQATVGMAGTWQLHGSTVTIHFDELSLPGDRLVVDGVRLDTTHLTLHSSLSTADTSGAVIVHRKGLDEVTFQDAAPGADIYTCKKG
jgi:hypothetical protein